MKRVTISAAGVASAAGLGLARFDRALSAGESLARAPSLFDACGFPQPLACEVPALDPRSLGRTPKDAKVLARASVVALAALKDLLESGTAPPVTDPWRSGLFLGVGLEQSDHRDLLATLVESRKGRRKISLAALAERGIASMNPLSSLRTLPNMALAHIGTKLADAAPRGANAAYSPFDAASLEAIAAAGDAVRIGECEVAIAGGADSLLSVFGFTCFHRLGMTGPARCIGEGAALFVVEDARRALAAGREPLAELEGAGSACDGAPVGRPHAAGAAQAIRAALAWRSVDARNVDVAILSGTRDGGKAPDEVGMEMILGEAAAAAPGRKAADLRVLLPRTVFGECAAASGALGVAAALCELSAGRASRAVVSAAAFGGSYAALVLKRWKA